jgi:hypothetical protein
LILTCCDEAALLGSWAMRPTVAIRAVRVHFGAATLKTSSVHPPASRDIKPSEAKLLECARRGAEWGHMRQEPGPGRGQDGFAVVDALVAVTILSSSLALSLMAAQVGGRASRSAAETRDAEMLLRERLESTAGQSGVWSGRDRGLDWRIEAQVSGASPARRAAPCVRAASAKAAHGRTYRIVTIDTCLSETAG